MHKEGYGENSASNTNNAQLVRDTNYSHGKEGKTDHIESQREREI